MAKDGENSVVVFAIDPTTGEPTLVQISTGAAFTGTFGIDPTGRAWSWPVSFGGGRSLPAGITVMRVAAHGGSPSAPI